MIADLAPLLITLSGRTGSVSARPLRRGAKTVITRYSRKHKPKMQTNTVMPCACQSWKKADYIYQTFGIAEKARWRAAVKKRHTSAYDIWMKATVYNFARNLNAPDDPPVSGGFSQLGNIPGTKWHPPPIDSKPWEPREDPDFWPGNEAPPGQPCPAFCDSTYATLYITIAGMTEEWAELNGTHMVHQDEMNPCNWTGDLIEKLGKNTPTEWAVAAVQPDLLLIAEGVGLSEEMDCAEGEGNFILCQDPVEDRCEDYPGWGGSFFVSAFP